MRYGVNVPPHGDYADPRRIVELAEEAEDAGWDGFFLWDHLLFMSDYRGPVIDPWIALAAIAQATERVRIGTLVTPLARRRPWKVARETVTLDMLSGGRLILGVGLGYPGLRVRTVRRGRRSANTREEAGRGLGDPHRAVER